MLSRIKAGIEWRYRNKVEPLVDLYGNLNEYLRYKLQLKTKVLKFPIVYIFANRRNIGDYISFRGVKEIVGLEGGELYCSKSWQSYMPEYLSMCKARGIVAAIGGGGLFQPAFENFWRQLLASEVEYVLIGVGINKMEGRELLDSDLLSTVINNAKWAGVRDTYSVEELERISSANVHLGICPSVNFISKQFELSNQMKANTLLHVYHPSDIRMAGADLSKIVGNLRQFAHDSGMQYKESSNMGTDYTSAIRELSSASLVVSSRLHGCIMSFATRTKFIPLYCDIKTENFVKTHTDAQGYQPQLFHSPALVQEACQQALKSEYEPKGEQLANKITENCEFGKTIKSLIVS